MYTRENCVKEFEYRFGESPEFVVRAPGRVNLIGEHTDYNDGFVLPMAIDRAVWIALRSTSTQDVVVHSLNLGQSAGFSLDNIRHENQGWVEYVKGIACLLGRAGYRLSGWTGLIASDVPMGAGLASSAALEIAVTRAFAVISGFPWEAINMAQIGQQTEREWIGVNCGIMDQMISAMGQEGRGLLIDCRSLNTELMLLPLNTAIVILDTSTRRSLVDSEYNERRAQCRIAAEFFDASLCDVSKTELDAKAAELNPVIYRRVRHVISENLRTLEAADAMRENNRVKLGGLLNESHESLRDDFEVSSPELNQIVSCSQNEQGCYGARMTGAGFGGCAVALVRSDVAQDFAKRVIVKYREATGLNPKAYVCRTRS